MDEDEELWVQLSIELVRANSLLRSAHSIAERSGRETNWNAFLIQIEKALVRQQELMAKYDLSHNMSTFEMLQDMKNKDNTL